MGTKQLLPLWYYGLEEGEREKLCKSESMTEVGGVQIPLWVWERAELESDMQPSKSMALQHAVHINRLLLACPQKAGDLWPSVCAQFDEALMILYRCAVKEEGLMHGEALASASAGLEILTLASIQAGADPLSVEVVQNAVNRYLSLRDKADDGTLTPEDLEAGACFSPEAGKAEESPAKS